MSGIKTTKLILIDARKKAAILRFTYPLDSFTRLLISSFCTTGASMKSSKKLSVYLPLLIGLSSTMQMQANRFVQLAQVAAYTIPTYLSLKTIKDHERYKETTDKNWTHLADCLSDPKKQPHFEMRNEPKDKVLESVNTMLLISSNLLGHAAKFFKELGDYPKSGSKS
jgi:hypothetical protein